MRNKKGEWISEKKEIKLVMNSERFDEIVIALDDVIKFSRCITKDERKALKGLLEEMTNGISPMEQVLW